MPKQTTDNSQAMNQLVTKVKVEQAEYQYRLANYFVPYNFDPEVEDFTRMGQLIEKHGDMLTQKVFGSASPQLQARVEEALNEITQRTGAVEALLAAGAEISVTDDELFTAAFNRVVNGSRSMAQARAAGVK